MIKARTEGKTVAIILDNASYHKSKVVKKYLAENSSIRLFYLPSYSPEYNPIERVWKWVKPHVQAAKTISNGLKELLERFSIIIENWKNEKLAKQPQIGLGVWEGLLCNYI